jgi:hypothetical protein
VKMRLLRPAVPADRALLDHHRKKARSCDSPSRKASRPCGDDPWREITKKAKKCLPGHIVQILW